MMKWQMRKRMILLTNFSLKNEATKTLRHKGFTKIIE
jgi:hypothetical protein